LSFLGPFKAVPKPSKKAAIKAFGTDLNTPPNPLPVHMQDQLQTEWCWAATAASISAFYGDNPMVRQCEVASRCLSMQCCVDPLPGPPPPDWDGNRVYTLSMALALLEHLSEPIVTRALTFDEIVAEIDAGRPVCCHIEFDDYPGHFNVIVGYDADTHDVIVRDPSTRYGDGTYPYEAFKSDYYGGTWDQSYRTRSRVV
jgi:hypothetical protein